MREHTELAIIARVVAVSLSDGVMVTPTRVIGDAVKSSGRLPRAPEIAAWLTAAAERAPR